MTLKQYFKGKLSKKELSFIPRSFDMVGSIAVFSDFPEELGKKEKIIGEAVLKSNKNIKTVAKKSGKHRGEYRTKKVKIMAGKRTKETLHKESKVIVKLNIETCYFSPRLSNERLRIAKQVKKNEKILCMFSGISISSLVIAKNSRPESILDIEINPSAHKYAKENIRMNKINNIRAVKGDVKKIMPNLREKFDRIIMPLPMSAVDFLKDALKVSKRGTVIHFYDFIENDNFKTSIEKIKREIKNLRILRKVKCGQFSPRKNRICIDFKIL